MSERPDIRFARLAVETEREARRRVTFSDDITEHAPAYFLLRCKAASYRNRAKRFREARA